MLNPAIWGALPFHFWSAVFFWFGAMVGSFLNVCIYRLPRGESVVFPPSHCPHCNYAIPWYLNIPLVTWAYLRAKCRNCGAPISARYFLVELLTALSFLGCWLTFGPQSFLLTLIACLILAGLIVATFIDFEHFIIPDEITIGGIVVGFVCSFLLPPLHGVKTVADSLQESFLGIAIGGGVIYTILRVGKLLFGRQKIPLTPNSQLIFTETALKLPDQEVPYEELFYRNSDAILFQAKTLELIDRCYANVAVRLTPKTLKIGDETINPEEVVHMEVVTDEIILPREAMGFGDVKFMAAIGAFLGWPAVVFSLMCSSVIGAAVGIGLIVSKKREWSSRIPYGPYIALAAVIWIFGRNTIQPWWAMQIDGVKALFRLMFGQ
jgi:leader peptidase (prepilin peptidase) / N-methyltransferase